MSKKNTYTTASYIPWDSAMALVRRLYRDGDYRTSLLIGCGCFFGLRISDLLQLRWEQILSDEFAVYEQKTGKRRVIKVNKGFQEHIRDCHEAMGVRDDSNPCFLNRFGSIITIQMVNRRFKEIKVKYQVKIDNFSTHTLRKTWARQIWEVENAAGRGDMALLKLSELMNHSAPNITRIYIGLRQQELGAVYDSLEF